MESLTYIIQSSNKWLEDLIREELHDCRKVYICSCGLGYDDMLIAYACDEYIRTHGISSEDITRRAVYNPRSETSHKANYHNTITPQEHSRQA